MDVDGGDGAGVVVVVVSGASIWQMPGDGRCGVAAMLTVASVVSCGLCASCSWGLHMCVIVRLG